MSTFGKAIEVSLFGESHGPGVGVTIHNLPPGITIAKDRLDELLETRRPKQPFATKRREKDRYDILSGLHEGITTGAPLTFFIENSAADATEYVKGRIRPSHADYTAYLKARGNPDHRGGGHFSGRLTAPLVLLGAVSETILAKRGVTVASHIKGIHTLEGGSFLDSPPDSETLHRLLSSDFPVINPDDADRFREQIRKAHEAGDSVGGIAETAIIGHDTALGEPFFDSFESLLSHLLFAIPGVKGVSFGLGFTAARRTGSEVNDPLRYKGSRVTFTKNDAGGILGGLSTGAPVIFQTAFKPTPSITMEQHSINMENGKNTIIKSSKRHDACLLPRALPVVNALAYYCVLEFTIRKEGREWTR